VWLLFNAVFGIYNLSRFDWTVLQAFNPGFGFQYLIRYRTEGWKSLGGILLAFTGVEALFADLGAFSMRAIQISWLLFAFPCLLLGYIGQAAYISVHPEAYSNPFFNCAPKGTIYPALIVAILAATVASQAIITATFQVSRSFTCSGIHLMFPAYGTNHETIVLPSDQSRPHLEDFPWAAVRAGGQLAAHDWDDPSGYYLQKCEKTSPRAGSIPLIILVQTTNLGHAYGVCVMFVTFFDTCMVSLAAIFVWKIHPLVVLLPFLTIACLDGAYLSSALTKVPNGAWFTLTLSPS
jgi:KUP system potassium uptake protein